jgi:hypothetical protein
MSRVLRSALLAFVLLVLCAVPGATAAAATVTATDAPAVDAGPAADETATQLSSGPPVARGSVGSSIVERGVACGRPDVRVHPVVVAVLPAAVGDRPLTRSESIEAPSEAPAGTAGSCAAGRAPPQATPTSR